MNDVIPVVIFAYARPEYFVRMLACLCEEKTPLLCVFSDGPKTPEVEFVTSCFLFRLQDKIILNS